MCALDFPKKNRYVIPNWGIFLNNARWESDELSFIHLIPTFFMSRVVLLQFLGQHFLQIFAAQIRRYDVALGIQ